MKNAQGNMMGGVPVAVWAQIALVLVWSLAAGVLLWASGVDVALQMWLDANYQQFFNTVMRWWGWLGLGRNQIVACALVAGVLWARRQRVMARVWLLCLPAFALAGVVNLLLKMVVGRPRPKELIFNQVGAFDTHPVWVVGFDSGFQSFPSGHSASTVAVATVLWLAFPRWRGLVAAFALVACVSRFLAVTPHYLGDVVAGAGVGMAAGMLVWAKWGKRP